MSKTDPDQTADQVADLQAQLDQTRSECIRPIIMEHIHRAMRAKSNTDKYHEYHALCVGAISYIDDEELKLEIMKDLEKPDTNLSNDFIRCYKAEMKSGVPNYLILENEYARLVPRIVRVWLKVKKALVEQELIPWSLTYPEQLLEGSLMDALIADIQMAKFRQAAPIHEVMAIGASEVNAQFPAPHNHHLDETEERGEEQAEEVSMTLDEADPPQEGERIAEPEPDRFSPLSPEPKKPLLPEFEHEEIPEYSDEEIASGAEVIKKLLQEKRNHVRKLRTQ